MSAPTNLYRVVFSGGGDPTPTFSAPSYGAAVTAAHLLCSVMQRSDGLLSVVNQGVPYVGPAAVPIAGANVALTAVPSGVTF